ncbi:hypothetical protein GCM10010415_75150 [Streptomyces atrovirens]|uniref:Uncharacterized protein n=1 Tax=Streptomyces atrovirens TaxID=285556 RepID=A0ABW0DME0_9ACTN
MIAPIHSGFAIVVVTSGGRPLQVLPVAMGTAPPSCPVLTVFGVLCSRLVLKRQGYALVSAVTLAVLTALPRFVAARRE